MGHVQIGKKLFRWTRKDLIILSKEKSNHNSQEKKLPNRALPYKYRGPSFKEVNL